MTTSAQDGRRVTISERIAAARRERRVLTRVSLVLGRRWISWGHICISCHA